MKKWLYFLIDDQGRSYYKDGNVIKKTSKPTPLPYTPDGWQDVSIGFERNLNRFGIFRTFTLPLGFVKTANDILRDVVLKGNVETKLFLLIKKLSVEVENGKYRFIYRYFYKGELDLTTVTLNDTKSTVSIMEGGISKMLAANESTVYEIPLDSDPEAIDVYVDGFITRTTITYNVIESDGLSGGFVLPMYKAAYEGFQTPDIIAQDVFFEFRPAPDFVPEENVFFFRVANPALFSYRVQGEINVSNDSAFPFRLEIDLCSHNRGTDELTQRIYEIFDFAISPGAHTITFDTTITVPSIIQAAESVYISVGTPSSGSVVSFQNSEIIVTFLYRVPATTHKALKPSTLFKRLCGKALGNENYAQSDLFTANDSIVVTCGDELRQIDNTVIKTSLKDFFEAYNSWVNIGASIENFKYRIEEKARYYDVADTPFHLGTAKNLEVSFAADLMFNLIKAGYPEQDYDEVWGKNEFNNTYQLTTPITRKKGELNLISQYRADPTGVEITRINYEGKTSMDSKNDNDVFVLSVDLSSQNLDGSYNLSRPAFDSITGIPTESQDTIYNVDLLTPKRILKKHGSWIRSVLYGFEDQRLKFQTTEKNKELRTVLGSEIIDEDLDELIGNLAAPLFKPYYFKFIGTVPDGIVEAIELDQNQYYTFTYDGVTYSGFAISLKIAANDDKEMEVTLLSTVENDLTNLL